MLTSAPHRWQLAREPHFDGGQVPQALSGLKVHALNKMLWPFTTCARTIRSKPFMAQAKVLETSLGK